MTIQPRTFSWLLFSDLQIQTGDFQDLEAATLLSRLWIDLDHMRSQTGPVDAVFFAGNLVWSGAPAEYEACSAILHQLFSQLQSMGSRPRVFCVPGNHDLVRSGNTESFSSLRFFDPAQFEQSAISAMGSAFQPYASWARRWNFPRLRRGTLPGDFCGQAADGTVGVVGLNTALNQGYEFAWEKIPLDPRRVDVLCGEPLEQWAQKLRLRLLLTHHPPEWFVFGDRSLPNGSKGFHVHLCGHADQEFRWPDTQDDSTTVIQVPRFNPRSTGQSGYVAGLFDLDDPSAVSVWYREYSMSRPEWRAIHELQEVLHVNLPVARAATPAPYVPRPIAAVNVPIYVESLRLSGFRAFDQLNLNFRRASSLPGEWTCIAGINGAGKSSILQALCLALLGDPLVRELGGERLNRMRRLTNGERQRAEIDVVMKPKEGTSAVTLSLAITDNGDIEAKSDPPGAWQQLRSRVVVAYGATRNLSSRLESGNENLSVDVRRQATLFDPLSQLANAEVLLKQPQAGPLLKLFENLVRQVFDTDLQVETGDAGVRFLVAGNDRVEAIDLPDGFRASAAWLADLCAIWCDKAPDLASSANPADMQAIVLIDEIDAHLHPALQRKLVPKLRAAMPQVQWIVTTHSPLVLSNFDSNEIVALDRSREGNVLALNRQILGFTSDQIYEWLMGTTPTGEAIEEVLKQNEAVGEPSDDAVAELLSMSPQVSEQDARERVQRLKTTIERLKP